MASTNGGGLRRPIDRPTEDAPIVGADTPLDEVHIAEVNKTEKLSKSDGVRRDYRNRIKRYINWLRDNYSDYAEEVIVPITQR